MTNFESFGLKKEIVDALVDIGFAEPFPIQAAAIPHLKDGEDVIGQAHTGTGKTAAFSLPMLNNLPAGENMMRPIKALILVPTRELAIQVSDEIKKFSKYTGHKVLPVYGGQSFQVQLDALRWGKDIVVATPGRLMDFMKKGLIDLASVEYVVLDEADRMLDMGFIEDIRFIMAALKKEKQVALFSATMPNDIIKLTAQYMDKPVKVLIDSDDLSGENITQSYLIVPHHEKFRHLCEMIAPDEKTIIFCSTKLGAARISRDLYRKGFRTVAIHGDLSQHQREQAIHMFKSGNRPILVATDVAARGLDIPEVDHVINYDVPNDPMAYFHRIGRTARGGASGRAFTIVSEDEYDEFEQILQHTKVPVKRLNEEKNLPFNIVHTPKSDGRGHRGGGPSRRHEGFHRGRGGFRRSGGRPKFHGKRRSGWGRR